MLTIGCHLSVSKGYLAMAKTAVSIGANTFQFFTRNPRGGAAKTLDMKDIEAYLKYASGPAEGDVSEGKGLGEDGSQAEGTIKVGKEKNFQPRISRVLAHAPYTLNAASAKDHVYEFAHEVVAEDLARMEHIPSQGYNMHPGAHGNQGVEEGIRKIATLLNKTLRPDQSTTVLLETMVGKGTEIGGSFEELAAIMQQVEVQDKVGVCLDTCHVWDAGYDVAHRLDAVLEEFDTCIGLEKLKAIHLNDSLNPCGARKDRHAKIGEGEIGFDAFVAIINHPALRDLPFYLETPNELPGYEQEIQMLREAYLPLP